jgi:hypothetical protein
VPSYRLRCAGPVGLMLSASSPRFCRLADGCVFVGLTSVPYGRGHDFFAKQIVAGTFAPYKTGVRHNFATTCDAASLAEFDGAYYIPKGYALFGPFDLAVLSLVDDFEIGTRTFRAYDPMLLAGGQESAYNFRHRTLLGATPLYGDAVTVADLARDTFLCENRLPYLAICEVKLNNDLVVGLGLDFLGLALEATMLRLKKYAQAD